MPNVAFVDPSHLMSADGMSSSGPTMLPPVGFSPGSGTHPWKRKRDCSFAESMDVTMDDGDSSDAKVRGEEGEEGGAPLGVKPDAGPVPLLTPLTHAR